MAGRLGEGEGTPGGVGVAGVAEKAAEEAPDWAETIQSPASCHTC